MVYSRATTSAMAERWVLPVGFLVDDILEGSVVSRVPQACNNFEENELIECCERNRDSGLRTLATTGFSCCGGRGRRSVVDAEYNEEALPEFRFGFSKKCGRVLESTRLNSRIWFRALSSDPTLCAPSRVAVGCLPADELLCAVANQDFKERLEFEPVSLAPLLIRHHHVAQGKVGPQDRESVAASLFHP